MKTNAQTEIRELRNSMKKEQEFLNALKIEGQTVIRSINTNTPEYGKVADDFLKKNGSYVEDVQPTDKEEIARRVSFVMKEADINLELMKESLKNMSDAESVEHSKTLMNRIRKSRGDVYYKRA